MGEIMKELLAARRLLKKLKEQSYGDEGRIPEMVDNFFKKYPKPSKE
jgi:hypothetical protein